MVKKYKCEICKVKRGKENYDFKCYPCWLKTKTIINLPFPLDYVNKVSMEEAQKKVRGVNTYFHKERIKSSSSVSLPSCYIGKKGRVIVVEEKDGN